MKLTMSFIKVKINKLSLFKMLNSTIVNNNTIFRVFSILI